MACIIYMTLLYQNTIDLKSNGRNWLIIDRLDYLIRVMIHILTDLDVCLTMMTLATHWFNIDVSSIRPSKAKRYVTALDGVSILDSFDTKTNKSSGIFLDLSVNSATV